MLKVDYNASRCWHVVTEVGFGDLPLLIYPEVANSPGKLIPFCTSSSHLQIRLKHFSLLFNFFGSDERVWKWIVMLKKKKSKGGIYVKMSSKKCPALFNAFSLRKRDF